MRIDLHTHSNRSDGTDSPEELMRAAQGAGLDVVALTDHDATTGWAEAQRTADEIGLRLVRGIEVSAKLQWASVHLLGYEFDPTDPALVAELERVIDGRNDRLPTTVHALNDLGIDITVEEVVARSDDAAATGRPHVADVLVDKGVVVDRDEAFARYLSPGKPAYVDRYATDLYRAVELITAAGGRAVVAHAWARGGRRVMSREVFADLTDLGLVGIEVDHNDHSAADRAALAAIATDLSLVTTGSSDYHGTGKDASFHLGCNTTDPIQFARLLG